MRIIKMGNIESYRHTCPYCSCEYEYDDKDVYIGNDYSSTGQYAYVHCPCCTKVNRLDLFLPKWYEPTPWINPITYYNSVPLSMDCKHTETHIPIIECCKGEENNE